MENKQTSTLLLQYKNSTNATGTDEEVLQGLYNKYNTNFKGNVGYKEMDYNTFKDNYTKPQEIDNFKQEQAEKILNGYNSYELEQINSKDKMGIFEYGINSWKQSLIQDNVKDIVDKREKGIKLSQDDVNTLKEYTDFQANVMLRGISVGGELLSTVGSSVVYGVRSIPGALVSMKAGAVGGAIGGSVAGPIGSAVGSTVGAIGGAFAGAKVNTLLMPDTIEREGARRINDKTLTITDKGELYFKNIGEVEEKLEIDKARKGIENENFGETIIDATLSLIPFGKLLPKGVVGSTAFKWAKKANDFIKVPGTTASSFVNEHIEEIFTDYLNILRDVDNREYNEVLKDYQFGITSANILLTGGIMRSLSGVKSYTTNKLTSKLESKGVDKGIISEVNNLSELQKESLLKRAQEKETEQDIQAYNTYLSDVKNKLVESGQTQEQAEASTKLFDLTTTYATSNYSDLSRVDFVKQNLGSIEVKGTPTEQLLNDKILFQGIKGQFDTKTKIISLFENSDITTFQHEVMHWYKGVVVNAVKAGSKQAQADLEVMNKFVGANDSNWTVKKQEKFARSYEQYLRNGIAPSENLKYVFEKVSNWFKEVYKTASELKVSLTPEITQFYDRIFKQGEKSEFTYNDKFTQLQQNIEEEKGILYQENPDLSEADIEAIIRQRFAKDLMSLEQLKKEVELVNNKAKLKAIEDVLKPKYELKSVSEQIEDRLKELKVPKDKKAIRKSIETLLKYSKNVKKGTKTVGRFLYEDSKFFNTIRDYDKLTQDQAVLELNNLEATEDKSTVEFGIKQRFLNYKAQGWYNTSIGLLSQIQQDLYNARELAKEVKDEADYIKLLNKNEAKDEILEVIKNKTADKDLSKTKISNLYRVDIANVWSLLNSITNKSIADKYNIEYSQNQTNTKVFNRVNNTTLKMQKVLGLKKYSQLVDTFNKWSLDKQKIVKSNGSKIDVSTMEILDIYNAIKNDKSKTDYYEEYGQGTIEGLVDRLTPQQKQIADIMMDDVQDYERLNKIHIELYNKDLPKVDNYWPATSEHESELDVFATYTNLSSSDISAMKERVKGKVKPVPRNAYSKYSKHILQTEWIEGISPMRKQISDMFLNNTSKDFIREKFGDRVVNRLNEEINDLSLTRQSQFMSSYEGALGKALNNWTVAKIGSPTVFIKQLSGVLNYAEEISSLSWVKNFSKGLISPKETYKFMTENAPFLEARYKQGMNEALRGAIEVSKTSKIHSNITSIATFMTRLGDMGSIIYGGYGQVKTLIDSGMSKEEAFKKFEITTIRSQQSGLSSSLAPMQKDRSPLKRMFFTFQNTPFQYMRKIYDTIYLYKNGDITVQQASKSLFMYGMLNPIIQTGLTAALPYLLYDIWDDDKKERRKNSLINEGLTAILTSPLAGIPFVSDSAELLISLGIAKAEDKKFQYYQFISMPMISDVEILVKRIADTKISTNDFIYAMLTGGEIATGIPLKNINKMQKTITDFDLLKMED